MMTKYGRKGGRSKVVLRPREQKKNGTGNRNNIGQGKNQTSLHRKLQDLSWTLEFNVTVGNPIWSYLADS